MTLSDLSAALDGLLALACAALALAATRAAWPLSWRRAPERLLLALLFATLALTELFDALGGGSVRLAGLLPALAAAGLLAWRWWRARDGAALAGSENEKLREELLLREASEQRLRAALAQYRRSAADFEQFAYAASHDLQAPLHNIEGFARLLEARSGAALDTDAKLYLTQIVDGVRQTQRLVDALLQLSRVGRRDARIERQSLSIAFGQARERLAGEIAQLGAVIDVRELPTIEADHALMAQLFQNLIANALKYQPPGQAPRLAVRARREQEDWHLTFTDNGIGIPAEQIDHVFAPFHRLHSQAQYSGSGMGLAICRKIAAFHDGEIWAEPHAGGARIHLLLPARMRAAARVPAAEAGPQARAS